tara:strand:+ start:10898 stop:11110 length:213 start_codon:yes stop_codon:yes gene_type:complete
MYLYEVFMIVESTALTAILNTKLVKVANVMAKNSSYACRRARLHYDIESEQQLVAYQRVRYNHPIIDDDD